MQAKNFNPLKSDSFQTIFSESTTQFRREKCLSTTWVTSRVSERGTIFKGEKLTENSQNKCIFLRRLRKAKKFFWGFKAMENAHET